MDMSRWLEDSRRLIDGWIADEIRQMGDVAGTVEEAMAYSLKAGGKRLRPQLVLAAGEYLGLAAEQVREVALAVEYLHTYSLIHDDLPAMDNDDFRRGKPTSHKVFGEAMAILAGDALLTEAFYILAELSEFAPVGVLQAMRRLSLAAGRQGLVRGQVQDLAAENQEVTMEHLEAIHRLKTGALFDACLVIPALLIGDAEAVQMLSRYSAHFGLAFQMVDDILNVIGDTGKLGKATGTDAGLGKATYPRLVGVKAAQQLVELHREAAKDALFGDRGELLSGLVDFAVDRTW